MSEAAAPPASRLGPALLAVSRIWVQLVNAAVLFAVTIMLDPTRFGAFMIASSAQAALAVLVGHGVYEYVIKERGLRNAAPTALLINYGTATAAALLGIGLSFALTAILHNATVGQLVLWLSPIFFIAANTVFMESVLIRDGRMSLVALCTMAADTAGVAVAIAGLYLGAGVFALVLQRACRELTLAALFLLLGNWRPRIAFDGDVARDMARFTSAIVSTRLVGNGGQMAIDVSIGALLSVADAGLFRLANRLVWIGYDVLYLPLRASLWAQLSALKDDADAFARTVLSFTETFGVALFAAIGGLAFISAVFLPLAFGPEWVGAAGVIYAIAAARLTSGMMASAEAVLGIKGRTDALVGSTVLTNVAMLGAIFLFARFGLFWTGVATGAATVLAQFAFLPIFARAGHLRARDLMGMWARLSFITALMGAVVLPILHFGSLYGASGWPLLICASAAGALVYIIAARFVTPAGYGAYAGSIAAAAARVLRRRNG